MLGGVDDRRSRVDLDRGRGGDRHRRADRAGLHADRRQPDRRRHGDRPAHDDDRRRARLRLQRPALLPASNARWPTGASIGPFAYLRPKARLEEGAKAGTFVEIKNSVIGDGAKVPHLSYIGDADIGEESNLGAATITANYDGFIKSRTKIGRNVRTGVDTTLIAPVEVGDDAYTGAGSVIGDDVPAGALALTRPEQVKIEGYAERKGRRVRPTRRPRTGEHAGGPSAGGQLDSAGLHEAVDGLRRSRLGRRSQRGSHSVSTSISVRSISAPSPTARYTAATASRFAAPTSSSSSRPPPTRRPG